MVRAGRQERSGRWRCWQFLLVAGAVTLQATSGAAAVTLQVASGWGNPGVHPLADAWMQMIQRFQAAHPDIKVEPLWGVSPEKLTTMIAGGVAPDVVGVGAQWVVPMGYAGQLTDLTPLMKQRGLDPRRFLPPAVGQLNWQGRQYGLPWVTNVTFAMLINTDLLDSGGFDSRRQPLYVDEVDEIQRKLTRRNADGVPTQLGIAPHEFAGEPANALTSWAFAFGGRWWDEATSTFTSTHPANVAALQWMHWHKTNFADNLNGIRPTSGSVFCGGHLALSFVDTFSMPNVAQQCGAAGVSWRLGPQPTLRQGAPSNPMWVSGPAMVIPVTSKHPQEAMAFIEYVTTSEEALEILVRVAKGLPGVLRSRAWNLLRSDSTMAPWVDFTADVRFSRPVVPNQRFWVAELNKAVQDVLSRGIPPLQALTNHQRLVTEDLARYR